jgi:hypothetical protein
MGMPPSVALLTLLQGSPRATKKHPTHRGLAALFKRLLRKKHATHRTLVLSTKSRSSRRTPLKFRNNFKMMAIVIHNHVEKR